SIRRPANSTTERTPAAKPDQDRSPGNFSPPPLPPDPPPPGTQTSDSPGYIAARSQFRHRIRPYSDRPGRNSAASPDLYRSPAAGKPVARSKSKSSSLKAIHRQLSPVRTRKSSFGSAYPPDR